MTKIFSWNVNGIRAVARSGAFDAFIRAHDPDILCLQETKATRDQSPLDLKEYTEFWNGALKKGYSGTAIFTKTEPLSVVLGIPAPIVKRHGPMEDQYGDPATEGRVVAAEFPKYWVVSVYTVNAKDDLSRIPLRHKHWDPAFLAYMQELEKTKPVIFCGDLNVAHTPDDLARPKENDGMKGFTAEEREGFDALENAGFVDTFRQFHKGNGHYSWWSNWANARERNVGWRIDYIMASKKLAQKVSAAAIHADMLGSDHCPVSIELSE